MSRIVSINVFSKSLHHHVLIDVPFLALGQFKKNQGGENSKSLRPTSLVHLNKQKNHGLEENDTAVSMIQQSDINTDISHITDHQFDGQF